MLNRKEIADIGPLFWMIARADNKTQKGRAGSGQT
jgi:hypothetical protein